MTELHSVVAAGDRRASLEALRDRLAQAIDVADERNVAALSKQLVDVLRELAALPVAKEESALDELAKRRADRLAVADPQAGAGGDPERRAGRRRVGGDSGPGS